MITLPMTKHKNSFTYNQVLRGKKSCIYRQSVSGQTSYYEVFIIKTKKAHVLFGKEVTEREIFPPDEAFGNWAWTCKTYEKALEKFKKLEKINK